MKRLLMVFVVMLGFVSFAWGDPPVKQVEVMNPYLNADIINQPVNVNVVNQSDTVCYEYHGIQKSNLLECLGQLNDDWAKDGWELVYFYSITVPPYYYTAIIRRPTECNPSP